MRVCVRARVLCSFLIFNLGASKSVGRGVAGLGWSELAGSSEGQRDEVCAQNSVFEPGVDISTKKSINSKQGQQVKLFQ